MLTDAEKKKVINGLKRILVFWTEGRCTTGVMARLPKTNKQFQGDGCKPRSRNACQWCLHGIVQRKLRKQLMKNAFNALCDTIAQETTSPGLLYYHDRYGWAASCGVIERTMARLKGESHAD